MQDKAIFTCFNVNYESGLYRNDGNLLWIVTTICVYKIWCINTLIFTSFNMRSNIIL